MSYWTQLLGRPFRVEQIDVNGQSTRSMVLGEGDAVIFLHGLSGHLEAFIPVAPYLADRYELHLVDMLGHGFTAKPGGEITIDAQARHLIDYMDVRGIAKAHVVGISLGGWVAGWLAAHHAERLLTATLIAAAGNPAMGRPEICDHVRKITLAGVMSEDRAETVKRLQVVMRRPESVDDELVDTRYAIYHMPAFRDNIEGLLAVTRTEIYNRYALTAAALAGVQCEVLLCWGEDDKNSGIADAQFLTDHLPRSKLIQMSDTGHWPPYERPADFASIADRFFRNGLSAVKAGRQ